MSHAFVRILPEVPAAARGTEPARAATAKPVLALTGQDGSFLARELSGKLFTVRVDAAPLAPSTRTGVSRGATLEIRLTKGFDLPGIVRDLASGKPVPGATVLARDAECARFGEEACPRTATGADGRFVLTGLARGAIDVEARAAAHVPSASRGIVVPRSSPAPGATDPGIALVLAPAAELRFRWADAGSKPVHAPEVELREESTGAGGSHPAAPEPVAPREASRAADGGWTIDGLTPGVFTIRVLLGDRGAVVRQHVTLVAGRTTDLGAIVAGERGVISGRVTDGEGRPVAAAEVVASWREERREHTRSVRTGEDGRYRIAEVQGVPVDRMTARAKGFASGKRAGAPPPDGIVDFVLERSGSIVGRVQASGGVAMTTAFRVHVQTEPGSSDGGSPADDDAPGLVSTSPQGSFRIDDLEPGSYSVEVLTDRHAWAKSPVIAVGAGEVADLGTLNLAGADALRGRVVDARGGAAIAGATVRVQLSTAVTPGAGTSGQTAGSAVTTEDGSFAVGGLQAGAYVVTVDHPSFTTATVGVDFPPDPDGPDLVVSLVRGGAVGGVVLDPQKQPAADVRILISRDTGEEPRTVATGPDGHYLAENLAPGTYQVVRQLGDGSTATGSGARTAVVREGETTIVDFDGSSPIVVRGHLLRGNVPLVNTPFVLMAIGVPPPGESRSSQSDPGGEFQIGLDHGGPYEAMVGTGGTGILASHITVKLSLPEQPEVEQDIVLPLNSISGRLTGPDGDPVLHASVTAARDGSGAGDPVRQSTAAADGDGNYRVDGIEPGTYRVTARATGYRAAEAYPVSVNDANPAPTVDLALVRGWVLSGYVEDVKGNGIPDAMVVTALAGQAESGALPSNTDATGAFTITAPADGPVAVTAIAAGFAPSHFDNVAPPQGDNPTPLVIRVAAGGSLRVRIVRSSDQPVPGVTLGLQPDPIFAGWDYVASSVLRILPTDGEGTTLLQQLAPGDYLIGLPGWSNVPPVRVSVGQGAESSVVIRLP